MRQDTFTTAFIAIVGEEGNYNDTPSDKGNWTGGAVGHGTLCGTKYGISASAFPALDIRSLTLAQAQLIYHGKYWSPIHGDDLPPVLAVLLFDAAVNNGVTRAVEWLQEAVDTTVDGIIGTITLAAVKAQTGVRESLYDLCAEFMDKRTWFMAGLDDWHINRGWCTRLTQLPWMAVDLLGGNS